MDRDLAAIGAGIYRRDIPGTCESEEVNARGLEATPSNERLQEFVRCAAMELESQGYFALRALSSDPRWRNGSIYLFGLDTYGNALFSGVGDAFGETFLYSELDAQSRQRNDAEQGDFRQEGRGLWPAHPGRLRLLSSG